MIFTATSHSKHIPHPTAGSLLHELPSLAPFTITPPQRGTFPSVGCGAALCPPDTAQRCCCPSATLPSRDSHSTTWTHILCLLTTPAKHFKNRPVPGGTEPSEGPETISRWELCAVPSSILQSDPGSDLPPFFFLCSSSASF